MKRVFVAAALLLNLSACGFDPVREAVNYQLDGLIIGETMLRYKAMGKIKVNHQDEKGTVSIAGTIDNKSYTAEFPTAQVSEMLSNPNNSMQIVFYLNTYVTEEKQQAMKFDHCAIILKENGQETRMTKQNSRENRECTKLLQELNDGLSLI